MQSILNRATVLTVLVGGAILVGAPPARAQLSNAFMIPAAAHAPGVGITWWRTDLSIHNPQSFFLPVVVQMLPTGRTNWEVPTLDIDIQPWETLNLWDVLGPDVFDHDGTAAILVYVDPAVDCEPVESCDFLATSRTYTLDGDGTGEFGQSVPGLTLIGGTDPATLAYAAGVLNDGADFRCNVGVASWTADWTTVQVDVQDEAGNILATEELRIPPFGHIQRRLATEVFGGSLVFYLVAGPDDALVYPYASVVNQRTGDPSFLAAPPSFAGTTSAKRREAVGDRRTVHPRPAPGSTLSERLAVRRATDVVDVAEHDVDRTR